MAIRAFRYGSSCVWAPTLPTGLSLRLGAPLANSPCLALGCQTLAKLLVRFITALHAYGHPCCKLALRCIRAPNLGEAILKNIPPSQNWFLSII
jgi:hypothetical protein